MEDSKLRFDLFKRISSPSEKEHATSRWSPVTFMAFGGEGVLYERRKHYQVHQDLTMKAGGNR